MNTKEILKKYQSEIIENGVYRITANEFSTKVWGDDLYIVNDPDYWGWRQGGQVGNVPHKRDVRGKIASSNKIWLEAVSAGTIEIHNKTYTFVGVFEKNGSVISLNTLHSEAIACV